LVSQLASTTATQRVKIAEKVHKPPFRVNVINFELNGFNASISLRPKKVVMH
jgi:hypothetical protein